jgi:hypothetical protein
MTLNDDGQLGLSEAPFGDLTEECVSEQAYPVLNELDACRYEVMIKQPKNPPEPKNAIHGMIEREDDGKFFACTHGAKNGGTQIVTGRTASEAKRLLEEKLKNALKCEKVFLVLKPMSPLEDHRCIR